MKLEYVPLLRIQRNLYELPRGFERFREYLRTMIDPDTADLKLPLVAMNPMGKEHLPQLLDRLIAFDTDGVAAQATADAQAALATLPGIFKVTLVLSDDALGGWTNRYTSEFGHRCGEQSFYKRGWTTPQLWTSETHTPAAVREEVLTCLYRLAYIQQHGPAHTLGEMLAQEGAAMAQAGATEPTLDPDDREYTREVLAPYLRTTEQPTLLVALFGDVAARELGYPPLGLSPRAGLSLALHNANMRQRPMTQIV
jgi:hypothetical protein